jgi:carboxy-terminal domain RNA polymerase II polypeptide A small phosphatase
VLDKKKKRSLLNVPSRSSSHHNQPSPTSTQLTGATASDPAESIGKGSKSSIIGKRRPGSVSSSQRSGNAQNTDSGGVEQSGNGGQFETEKPAKQTKAGVSRFLGFLNCCGVSSNASSGDGEDASEPPKKARFRGLKVRQSTPVGKREVGPEPSTADSKDPDEKAAFGDSDKPVESKLPHGVVQDGSVSGDPKASDTDSALVASRATLSNDIRPQDRTPAIPLSERQSDNQGPSQPAEVRVVIQAPTPVVPQQEDMRHLPEHRNSPSNGNDDIEMVDAPPLSRTDIVMGGVETAKVDLSLPTIDDRPPVAEQGSRGASPGPSAPEARSQHLSPSQDGSLIASPEAEKQQYLLPPIDPHFKGKKCLVLDLDETLVHSSFKVLPTAMSMLGHN